MKARTVAGGQFNNIDYYSDLNLNIDVHKQVDNAFYRYNVNALLLWHEDISRWYGQTTADSYQTLKFEASDIFRIGERYDFEPF